MLTSHYAADEALRNVSGTAHLERLNDLLTRIEIVHGGQQIGHDKITVPAKDGPILSGALNARSRFLVTGDRRHFGAYFNTVFELRYGLFTIIEPSALLKVLKDAG